MLLLVLSALLIWNVQTVRLSVEGTGTSVSSGQISSGSIGRVSHEYNTASAVMIIINLFIFYDI